LNTTHIWVGGGSLLQKNPDPEKSKEITLTTAWLFDGFSWMSVKEMTEKRNLAACSIVIDQSGEVRFGCRIFVHK
jgi:hypothetical protein